jgi:hypothetical protein
VLALAKVTSEISTYTTAKLKWITWKCNVIISTGRKHMRVEDLMAVFTQI